jgi:hypothetical protein
LEVGGDDEQERRVQATGVRLPSGWRPDHRRVRQNADIYTIDLKPPRNR